MEPDDIIDIVIPTYNRRDLCLKCIESINEQTYKNIRIILVDDHSHDNTTESIKSKFPEVTILNGTGNLWWTGATNLGCEYALNNGAQLILTLNDDLILGQNYLEEMIKAHRQFPRALIGSLALSLEKKPRLLYAGDISHSYWTAKTTRRGRLLSPYNFNLKGVHKTLTLPGRGTLIPQKVFQKIGLFDFRDFPHYGADYDFSLRAKENGFGLLVNTNAVLYSHCDKTGTGNIALKENLRTYLKSFFSFKSSNYLPVSLKLAHRHHPFKIYLPVYFLLSWTRKIGSHVKHRHFNH